MMGFVLSPATSSPLGVRRWAADAWALPIGEESSLHLVALWVLLGLFVLRVLGQLIAAVAAPAWLPPMRRWYSGVMRYRYLLPAQLAIIVIMVATALAIGREHGMLGTPRPAIGTWLVIASYVYAAGMLARLARWLTRPPAQRGVFIPIVFHFVLAAFLFIVGSWHANVG
jgi:hypothetical protein